MRFPSSLCIPCQTLKTFLSEILDYFVLSAFVILRSHLHFIFFYSLLQQHIIHLSNVHWDFHRCKKLQSLSLPTSNLFPLQNEVLAYLSNVCETYRASSTQLKNSFWSSFPSIILAFYSQSFILTDQSPKPGAETIRPLTQISQLPLM